ncbi:hypothetical protein TorRG33x02_319240 [Trema orientale]|uniref:Uncharacterized protein n=1 Tax=Trema orientale TaxID=63057 RepID=A0A2P5BJ70_TREOI|nr:hypothetical protein TorRG33x02_319240 [Trema orientale]
MPNQFAKLPNYPQVMHFIVAGGEYVRHFVYQKLLSIHSESYPRQLDRTSGRVTRRKKPVGNTNPPRPRPRKSNPTQENDHFHAKSLDPKCFFMYMFKKVAISGGEVLGGVSEGK